MGTYNKWSLRAYCRLWHIQDFIFGGGEGLHSRGFGRYGIGYHSKERKVQGPPLRKTCNPVFFLETFLTTLELIFLLTLAIFLKLKGKFLFLLKCSVRNTHTQTTSIQFTSHPPVLINGIQIPMSSKLKASIIYFVSIFGLCSLSAAFPGYVNLFVVISQFRFLGHSQRIAPIFKIINLFWQKRVCPKLWDYCLFYCITIAHFEFEYPQCCNSYKIIFPFFPTFPFF